ncbi:hypothetical protein BDV95DRAFT_488645, partial [Massariosphaeria phaeospora]
HYLKLITNMLKNFKNVTNFLSKNYKLQLMYNCFFNFLNSKQDKLNDDIEN